MVNSPMLSLFNHKLYPQWIAVTGVVQLLILVGVMNGWSSPYLARLTVPGAPIFLTLAEASWVASLLNMGRLFGAVIGALSVHFWGSKNAIIHTLMPIALHWILMLAANGPVMLYIARFTGGLSIGMVFSCFPLYVGEIALPQIRGAMVTVAFCGFSFGFLIISIVGYYLSLTMSSVVFLIICLMDIAMFIWLPDSPHHLMKIGNLEAARQSIYWYRNGDAVNEEFVAVQKFILSPTANSFRDKLSEFNNPPIRKTLFIVIMLSIYVQISGLNSILFYIEIILRRGKSDFLHPSLVVILANLLGTLTALMSVNMMDKCGRKILLVISGIGVSVATTALGTHFLLIDLGFDPTSFKWLPVASTFLFTIALVFGLTPVPSTVLSEVFPANIKCIAACMYSLFGALFAFGSSKTYQPMINAIGEAYVFYIYAALIITVVPFVMCFMPETKGKSLQEIQDDLMKT